MLLQQAIVELDAELKRLYAIRSIVFGLATASTQPSSPLPRASKPAESESESREAPAVPVQRGRLRKVRAASRPKTWQTKAHKATALSGAVPSTPVAISVQALQRERENRAVVARAKESKQITAAPQMALDALSRDLAARWLTDIGNSAQEA